ncbi:uncharacterized protein LOC110448770 [Mizuhopecten yessoensis]|uniref:uncharacterized protein LOC110448770 n=1 Tax=Mizuhopecten yessoensis TaxID=6573 RepID=UPI000B4574E1|nr:uncharacterized protein LOC110448770 [Mizuhopecten yessoensis]
MSDNSTSEILTQTREVLSAGENSQLNHIISLIQKLDVRLQHLEPIDNKLDLVQKSLDSLSLKVNSLESEITVLKAKHVELETSCTTISAMYDQVKTVSEKNKQELQKVKKSANKPANNEKVTYLEKSIHELMVDKDELTKSVTELKWRSMKDNLVFSGLYEEPNENTEAKLRSFLHEQLGIDKVELGNTHRFGKHVRGRPRPIVARFLYNHDRANVLNNARHLKGTQYYINEQFPTEIEEKRRKLYPKMKELRQQGKRVKLVRDRLIVNVMHTPLSGKERFLK